MEHLNFRNQLINDTEILEPLEKSSRDLYIEFSVVERGRVRIRETRNRNQLRNKAVFDDLCLLIRVDFRGLEEVATRARVNPRKTKALPILD
jgi:hypothetical protein